MRRDDPYASINQSHPSLMAELLVIKKADLSDHSLKSASISQLVLNVRHQGNMSCSLDRYCKSSLVFCTVSCDPSRKDLASLRNIFLQLCNVLVIDLVILFTTEYSHFFSSARRASSLESALWSASLFVSHDGSPFFTMKFFFPGSKKPRQRKRTTSH